MKRSMIVKCVQADPIVGWRARVELADPFGDATLVITMLKHEAKAYPLDRRVMVEMLPRRVAVR